MLGLPFNAVCRSTACVSTKSVFNFESASQGRARTHPKSAIADELEKDAAYLKLLEAKQKQMEAAGGGGDGDSDPIFMDDFTDDEETESTLDEHDPFGLLVLSMNKMQESHPAQFAVRPADHALCAADRSQCYEMYRSIHDAHSRSHAFLRSADYRGLPCAHTVAHCSAPAPASMSGFAADAGPGGQLGREPKRHAEGLCAARPDQQCQQRAVCREAGLRLRQGARRSRFDCVMTRMLSCVLSNKEATSAVAAGGCKHTIRESRACNIATQLLTVAACP